MLEKTDSTKGKDNSNSGLPDVGRQMEQYKLPKRSATDLPATNTGKPELPRRLTDQEMWARIADLQASPDPMDKVRVATQELNELVIAEEKKSRKNSIKEHIQNVLRREGSDPVTKAMEEREDVVDPRLPGTQG